MRGGRRRLHRRRGAGRLRPRSARTSGASRRRASCPDVVVARQADRQRLPARPPS
ncbi:MAG: hypothetical protein MZV64_12510 [Ignavibacteriales bacterium]|nr:hypothetical protein [Ignavibacteriales bacterium]